MNVWLTTVGEQVPIDGPNSRLLRTGLLAKALVRSGNSVTWWTSTFNHVSKQHRFDRDTEVKASPGLVIKFLYGGGYRRHVSLSRLVDHMRVGSKFWSATKDRIAPDLIVSSLPTLELAASAARYAAHAQLPLVLDIRDLWPDLFADALPPWAKHLAPAILGPFEALAKYSCRKSAAIIAPAESYLTWGLAKSSRKRTSLDVVVPFAYESQRPSDLELANARERLQGLGYKSLGGQFLVCFFGVLGRQFNFEPVVRAAEEFQRSDPSVRFVVCGTGDREEDYRIAARHCHNIQFLGWVGKADIWLLLRSSSAGLAPYGNSVHFNDHIPNKPLEYLSAGLPILSSIDGALGSLIRRNDCGLVYANSNPGTLIAAIRRLRSDADELSRMKERACALYKRSFDADIVYPGLVKHLSTIADSFRCKPLTGKPFQSSV